MFKFLGAGGSYYIYRNASETGEINLSLTTIGEFNCKNEHFVSTIVHEVVHLNCWEDGHNANFQAMNNLIFRNVWTKLNERRNENATTIGEKETIS